MNALNHFDSQSLCKEFQAWIRGCRSSSILAHELTAFESWFRVEFAAMLQSRCKATIEFNYNYPGDPGKKADLCINGNVVVEIKCFSAGRDSHKKKTYPQQISRLYDLVDNQDIKQAVCLTTFSGYTDHIMSSRMTEYWPKTSGWIHSELLPLKKGGKCYLLVSTLG
jgi:hypothetical protein